MPGRHHTEPQPGDATVRPVGTLVAVGIAVLLIIAGVATIAAWIAPSTGKDSDLSTIVVQPSASLPVPTEAPVPEPPSTGPLSTSPTASAPPSGSSEPTTSVLVVGSEPGLAPPTGTSPAGTSPAATKASVTSTPSRVASPTPTTARRPPTDLTATYAITSSSADGFVANVTVRNPTTAAQSWTVVLSYSSGAKMMVTGYWNATPTPNGRRLTFAGGPLAAGASYSFGFRARTDRIGAVSLTDCTINGIACIGF